MKNLLKYAPLALVLAFGACTAAHGMVFGGTGGHQPEVDPSLAVSGLTLLAGTLAVLRVRRKK